MIRTARLLLRPWRVADAAQMKDAIDRVSAKRTLIVIAHRLSTIESADMIVVLDDGRHKKRYHLNRSYSGLYVCPMVWRELDNFSSGSVCMVLASNKYDEADYYRDYPSFINARGLA